MRDDEDTIRRCRRCGKEFNASGGGQEKRIYCSDSCRVLFSQEKTRSEALRYMDQTNAELTQRLYETQTRLAQAEETARELALDKKEMLETLTYVADEVKLCFEKKIIQYAPTLIGMQGRADHSRWTQTLERWRSPARTKFADLAEYDAMWDGYRKQMSDAQAAGDLPRMHRVGSAAEDAEYKMFRLHPEIQRAVAWREFRDDYRMAHGVELSDDETTAAQYGYLV